MGTNAAFEQSEAPAEETYTFGDVTGNLFDADTEIAPSTTSGATVANLFEDELTSTAPSDSASGQPAGSNIFDVPPAETTSNPFGEEAGPVASIPDVVPSAEASIFGGTTASAGSATSTGNAAASNPFSTLDVLADSLPATATSTQQSPQQQKDGGLIGILNDK